VSLGSSQPPGRLIVREARTSELDEVAYLLKECYQEYQKEIPPDVWESYVWDIMNVRGRLADSELLIGELDGRLAGSVTLFLDASKSAEEGWPRGWAGVRLLGVHPAYRNRGIGRALMNECIRRCRERGIHTIGLHTSNLMAAAVRMYERMGFTRITELDFQPRPGVTVMAYRLDL
jgi:ribosomal protein S18 acetylase RimI-like enzyme